MKEALQTMRIEMPKKKAQKGFAIDTFLQKGPLWSLAVFSGSVLLLGILLRLIDGILFSQEEPSTCLWEVIFSGSATGALLLATGPKIAKRGQKACSQKSAPRRLKDEDAQVGQVVQELEQGHLQAAEENFIRLSRCELSTSSTVSLIAACAAQASALHASKWLVVLKTHGAPIIPKSLQLVVDALLKEERLVEAETLVMKMLDSPVAVVSGSLTALFRRIDLTRAEELLRCLRETSVRHWLLGISALLRSERHVSSQTVEQWMQRAIESKVPLEAHLFHSAINATARLGQPELAENWLERMTSHFPPDSSSIGAVVSAYKLAKKKSASDYMQRVKAKEMQLDCAAFNQIIKSCIHVEDLEAADRWLQLAVDLGAGPLESLWISSVVGGGIRLGKADIPERWICFQAENGLSRDSSSFNAVIACHNRQGNFHAAERLVRFMCQYGIEPDVVTLAAAVHSFARGKRPKKAEEMFEMILMRGQTRADVVSFNALIDAWVKAEDVQRAKYWLERMLEVGVEPTVISYTTVLNAYAKQGNIEAAEEIMEQMKSKQLEANVVTYTALINACVKAGDVLRAERFFGFMNAAGIEANAMTFSSVLNVCAKAGDYKRAEAWLEKMCCFVVPTEVCFNNVIDACAKAGQAARAEDWLWRIKGTSHGLSPTRQSFTAAAQGYAKSGAFLDVERLFRAMEAEGIRMDPFCLTVQLSAYARARPRQRERMEETLRKYHKEGLRITPPPLRVAKSVLGNARLQQLLTELGIQDSKVDEINARW